MKRRIFLGLLSASIAGCTATGAPSNEDSPNRQIMDTQFTLVDPKERISLDESDVDNRFQHAANVQFNAMKNQIIVRGRLKSGSRSCMETVLESASYNEKSDILTVVVSDKRDESATICTDEISIVAYESTITFDLSLPGTVVVKHRREDQGIVFTNSFTSSPC
ncbi:hypothetical protein [Haloferax prahovense]|uniref:hypothetical protein n=1 Tax=Haloferax prahovense TaxID=381852 RepID=UPI000A07291F|nr:hypothetical protein [Haloferax prahovense]